MEKKKKKRRQNEVNKREQTDLPVIDSLLGAASKSVLLSASPLDAFKYKKKPPKKNKKQKKTVLVMSDKQWNMSPPPQVPPAPHQRKLDHSPNLH